MIFRHLRCTPSSMIFRHLRCTPSSLKDHTRSLLWFQLICSYVFWLIPLVMGVDPSDCRVVAELIGTKIFLNEFIAYEKLGYVIKNRNSCIEPYISVSRQSRLHHHCIATTIGNTYSTIVTIQHPLSYPLLAKPPTLLPPPAALLCTLI